jgi:DNA-binding phage protein
MPICGYNEKMGAGVKLLAEGLILSLRKKAERKDLSMAQQMAAEERELSTYTEQLHRKPESPKTQAWLGLVYQVRYLMQPANSAGLTREEFEAAVRKRAEEFDQQMIKFEDHFEANEAPLAERLEEAYEACGQ